MASIPGAELRLVEDSTSLISEGSSIRIKCLGRIATHFVLLMAWSLQLRGHTMQIFFSSNLLGLVEGNTVAWEYSSTHLWSQPGPVSPWRPAQMVPGVQCYELRSISGRLKGIGHLAKKEHTSEQCLKIQRCCFAGNAWFTVSRLVGNKLTVICHFLIQPWPYERESFLQKC